MLFVHLLNFAADTVIPKPGGLPGVHANEITIAAIINIVLNIVGAIALLIITFAGLKYVLSRGEPQATAKAKDTILYALVGLAVVIMGRVIVAFVFNKVDS